MPPLPMDPAKLIARRKRLGLTQQQVAERAKMPYQGYERVESGRRADPRLSTAERIADALETTVDALRVTSKRKPAR